MSENTRLENALENERRRAGEAEARVAALEGALREADALADRWEKIDGKADDFGRAIELVRYREARSRVAAAGVPDRKASS